MIGSAAKMLGGGKKIRSILSGQDGVSAVGVVVILVFLFLLRALVVQLAYNKIAPKIISQWNKTDNEYKPLSFQEALMFTILVSFLFI